MAKRITQSMATFTAQNTTPWSIVSDGVHRRRETNASAFAARRRAAVFKPCTVH